MYPGRNRAGATSARLGDEEDLTRLIPGGLDFLVLLFGEDVPLMVLRRDASMSLRMSRGYDDGCCENGGC